MGKPTTMAELVEFYYDKFKPIYDHAQLLNAPAIQLLLEVHAAFDHLTRHWKHGQDEAKAVDRAARHLKRGTFDAFKLIIKETRDQYDELMRSNIGVIDNGEFEKQLIQLWAEIREGAFVAQNTEGDSGTPEKWDRAFELWEDVHPKCVELRDKFFRSTKVQWAKTRQARLTWRERAIAFVVGFVTR